MAPDIDPYSLLTSSMRPLRRLSGLFVLPPRQTLRGAFYRLVWEGTFAQAFLVLTSGGLLIGLAKYLNASNWEVSLLNALAFLVMPFQTILGVHFNKAKIRKKVAILTAIISRVLWLAPMILVLWKPHHAILWLLLFVFIQNVAFTVSTLCWLSWIGDLVSVDLRGRFFGARQRGASIANVVVYMSAGALLDKLRETNREDIGHFVIGAVAIVLGLISAFLLNNVPRTLRPVPVIEEVPDTKVVPWRDPAFRRIMIGFGAWYAAVGFAGPYWAVHMLTHLNFGYKMLAGYGAGFTIMMALVSPFAGRWIDKYGDFGLTTIGMICLSSVPIYWIFITPSFPYPVILEIIVTAFGWAAVQLTSSTIPLRYSTPLTRNKYLAALSLAIGIGFTIGAIVGGVLMDMWDSARGSLFGIPLFPTHFAFAITGLLRLSVAVYFFRLSKQLQTAERFPIMVV